MIKKLLTFLLGIGLLAGSAQALSTYTSVQTGHNPANGYVLQSDGSESYWVATSTLGITQDLTNYVTHLYASSTFPSFAYASSTYLFNSASTSLPYLKLDQSIPQTVASGTPTFSTGINVGPDGGDAINITLPSGGSYDGVHVTNNSNGGGDGYHFLSTGAYSGDVFTSALSASSTGRGLFLLGGSGATPQARIESGSRTLDTLYISNSGATYSYRQQDGDLNEFGIQRNGTPYWVNTPNLSGNGLLKVTAGVMGTDTNTYLTDAPSDGSTYGRKNGAWSAVSAGFVNPMTTLGDIIFENSTPTADRLAGNTTTTKKYLQSVGSGGLATAPSWQQIAYADVSGTPDLSGYLTASAIDDTAYPTGWDGDTTHAPSRNAVFDKINSIDVSTYLKIDQSNGPITGNVNVSKADPELRVTDTGNSEYARLVKTDTTNYAYQYNRIAQPSVTSYAFSGDGTRTKDVTITDDNDFSMTSGGGNDLPFSISAWVYMTDATNFRIASKATALTNTEWAFGFSATDFLVVRLYDNNTTNGLRMTSNGAGTSLQGGWHQIGMTYDGSKTSAGIKLYVDGSAVAGTGDTLVTYATAMVNNTSSVTIGSIFRNDAGNGQGANGRIDDVAIWKNRELAASEMSDIYNSGTGLTINAGSSFPSTSASMGTGLKGLYHLDEGTGTSAADTSGLGHNGTNNGSWATGFGFPAPVVEAIVWKMKDGVNANERGLLTFGDYSTTNGTVNTYEGLSHTFDILGASKGVLNSTAMAWTLPNTITGASDTVQFKILGNSTQTSDIMQILASDGTTPRLTVTGAGFVGVGIAVPQYSFTIQKAEAAGTVSLGVINTTASGATAGGHLQLGVNDNAAIASGDRLGILGFGASSAASQTSLQNGTSISSFATENWSGTARGSALTFETTANTTLVKTERLRIDNNGNVGIGASTTISAKTHIISTTEQLRLGYDANNYLSFTVASAGSATLAPVGTTPYLLLNKQPYGSMYADDVTLTVTIAASGTYYAVPTGLTTGLVNGFTFANSVLTCLVAGKYKVDWSMTLNSATANQEVTGAVMINTTGQMNTEGATKLTTANDNKLVSGSGIITLAANDLVKLSVENETGTNNIIVTHATLSLVRISD